MIRTVITCDGCGDELTEDEVFAMRMPPDAVHQAPEWQVVISHNRNRVALAREHLCEGCAHQSTETAVEETNPHAV